MTDFQINDHLLTKECDALAKDIFDEICGANPDTEAADLEDEMRNRTHETIDGHGWVIYNYKALMCCAHCSVDQGEEFLGEMEMPETPTIYSLASIILFVEMEARVQDALRALVEEKEEAA